MKYLLLVLLVVAASANASSINRRPKDTDSTSLVQAPVQIANAVGSTLENVVDIGREAVEGTHTIVRDVITGGTNIVNDALGAVKGIVSFIPGVSQVVGGTIGVVQDQVSTVNVGSQALLHSTHGFTDRVLGFLGSGIKWITPGQGV